MAAAANSVSLKEYLKRYENPTGEENKKKKKKKKETKANAAGGVRVVDEDPIWQKPIKIEDEEEENDSADEDKPQIDEDVEVKRMKRLEEVRSRRPYLAISDDGSGWITVSDSSKQLDSGHGVYNMFPPHQDQGRSRTPSSEPMELNTASGEADLSPPRQRSARFDTPSPSPELKLKRSDSPDLSPPRRSHPVPVSSDSRRKDSEIAEATDLSPPRRSRPPTVSSDFRRKNSERNSSPDLSPPRRSRPRTVSSDLRRMNSERDSSDLSPPRSLRPSTVSSDFRRKSLERNDSPDLSPARLGRKHFPEVDTYAFPEADLSPPRKAKKDSSSMKVVREAGLLTQEEMKEDNTKKKKEELLKFSKMDPSISGRGAGATYRFQGQRISKEEFLKLHEEEKPKEKKIEWGKGLAQKKEAEARKLELELEKDKPFARTKDDPELDKMLKERIRWGDPMAHLVKRKNPELVMEDLGDDEKMKESGFIIPQTIPSHSWIKRGIDPPGNRYGIRPGRHWDGVDRSNGFEKESFKRQNDKRATEREAYLWSVSDM